MERPTTHSIPGFKVTKTDTATVFHKVPIFAECSRGDLSFDAAWLHAAVAEAKQQERDGYLPPLHTLHHEPATEQNGSVESVGVFRITHAAPMSFKGKQVLALFADLLVTDEWMADQIGRMKYPYRSVEIFEPEGAPKINSLALLDHEAPYLELPMLFEGEVDDQRDPRSRLDGVASATSFTLNYRRTADEPVLCSSRRGEKAVMLFKFPDQETMRPKQAKPKASDSIKFSDGPDYDEKEAMSDEDEDAEKMEGEGGLDIAAICAAIESGEISVADKDAILAAIQASQNYSDEEDENMESEEPEKAPAPVPGAEIMRGAAGKEMARMQAKIDLLEAKHASREASEARTVAVAEAMERLAGKPLGSNLEAKLTNFHKKAGGDAELFKEYVDAMAKSAGTLPPGVNPENFSAQPNTPAAAMAYQPLGGEAVDLAASFCREYDSGVGATMRASKESYVQVNMRRLGHELPVTA